ncbi:MAG: transposase [Candidatus Heimdallarchaeaceae archaeon]
MSIPKNVNKTYGKTVLFGEWDVHSHELWSVFSPKRDTVGFLVLLDTLVMEGVDSGYDTVYLLLDNLSVHKAKKVKAWNRAHPKFEFVFLPTYSPQLQPIEGLFSVLQREVLDNYWWSSVDEIHKAIIQWKYFYNTDRLTIHPRLQHRPRASRVLYTPDVP